MADLRPILPALLVVAQFSRHEHAMQRAFERLEQQFGPIPLISPAYDFVQTAYYEQSMGAGLRKRFLVFERLIPPDSLPGIKLFTNDLERQAVGLYAEERPLNLDPGLLTLGKFMLATTKDQAHRIYLGQGIFAEVTLRYQGKSFAPWEWTYADYRLPEVIGFLNGARNFYRRRLRDGA